MENLEKLPYVLVRTDRAGVHIGYLKSCTPMDGFHDVELLQTRRIWSWAGANSITDLANKGSKKPDECKFTAPALSNRMMAIEILQITDEGKKNIESIPEWVF